MAKSVTAYQVAIIGHGAHGSDIEHIWNSKHPLWPMVCFDDEKGPTLAEAPNGYSWFIGVNDSQVRAKLALLLPGPAAMPLIHAQAVVDGRCDFGHGVVVGANTTIIHDVILGEHTQVNYNVGMTRCHVGDFVTISPGVTIAGDVTIGHRTWIGSHAAIGNLVSVGADVVVGMGSVVLPETQILDGETWVGNPARRIK